ncbi:MAG: M20/M25/M40 family metallo-hydrolase [Elusimicrobia bacterium]|nr:M20/M25/M40 family metallo-hydrolase [Elusimicrobiota bacterium]
MSRDAVALLRRLVQTPSESGAEDAAADLLEGTFKDLGWEPRRTGRNLHAVLGSGGPTLLFNSHMDTVPVGAGWTKPPLEAVVEDGRVYGRGANDAKGCLTAMILGAAAAFEDDAPRGTVVVSAVCEEETTNRGMAELLPLLPRPDAAVVGEPTGLAPAVAQKGLLLLEVMAEGRAAHAAWGGGDNAVTKAARDVLALEAVGFDRPHPALGLPSLAVTQIHGGERHNVIPDRCKLVVDIRTTPAYEVSELVAMVQGRVGGAVTVRSSRLGAVDTDPAQPVVRAALAAGAGACFGSPTISDWVALKGIPTVKVGPGDSRRSHTLDEFLTIAELEAGVAYYERLIRAYFGLMGGR